MDFTEIRLSGKTRREHDLLGEMEIPAEYYFGVQTMRAVENFHISRVRLNFFPELIRALADVKQGAAMANRDLGLLDPAIADAIIRACEELRAGKLEEQFVVDMVQGGAGTSTNMNANEVIANRALELLGHEKGEYQFCHPNNHVNLSQSTNDAYPTAVRIALVRSIEKLVASLRELIAAFHAKGEEFSGIIKMGRTQLQDAVPMTLGQEFEAYAANLTEETERLTANMKLFFEINMGATAIGTGINADPDYAGLCTRYLREITGLPLVEASNMIEATSDTGAFIMNSSACGETLENLQRPAAALVGSPLRAERDQPPAAPAGIVDHAGQGQPRDPRSRQPGSVPRDRQRPHRDDRIGSRTARTERHGADHRPLPVREHRNADQRHEHAAREVHRRHHGQRGGLPPDGL